MEGQSQKREVRTLEAKEGKFGRNPKGSSFCAIHRTSRKEQLIDGTTELMEQLVAKPNMTKAYRKVLANKGSAGIDKMEVEDLQNYLWGNWERIKMELLEGRYQPQAVRRVEIPKANGGKRKLGIPTVLDRLIQQAIHQILSPIFEPGFSNNSFGFRPKRKAQDALTKARNHVRKGKRWVVDIDLEKFFDKVNHDILMERIRRKVKDMRVLTLIRGYLTSGVMENGIVKANGEGTPQGGPLSPLLSNIMLTDLDKELERRGHAFCRYADDCVPRRYRKERIMKKKTAKYINAA
jgi:RNA-directed DNA polymerase